MKAGLRTRSVKERGYVLLLVMLVVAILLISLTAALPDVYTEAQREKETELIFRGTQYARAIYLYHQQFHHYPMSVKDLLRTNGMSFLRRPYTDPMTRSGKWRFIHATANGIIVDSKDITVKPAVKPGESSSSTQEGASAGAGFSRSSDQQPPAGAALGTGFGQSGGQQQDQGMPPQTDTNPFGQGQMLGAFIVGVASTSPRASIRVYNKYDHYDKWEFIGVPGVPGSVVQLPMMIPGMINQSQPGEPSPPAQNQPPNLISPHP